MKSRQGPLFGRDSELAVLRASVDANRGAVIIGDAGTGKTHLASALASEYAEVLTIASSPALTSVPFGACVIALGAGPSDSSPAALVAFYVDLLRDQSLIVVDDVHDLDEWSVNVVVQLVRTNAVTALFTARTEAPCASQLTHLWESGLVDLVRLGALDVAAVAQLAEGVGGMILDDASLHLLYKLTKGHPLFVKEVIIDAIETGDLRMRGGRCVLHRQAGPGERLRDVVSRRLGPLDDGLGEVVAFVALAEPLDLEVLKALTNAASVRRALDGNLITARRRGSETSAWLGHPLYGDHVRWSIEPEQKRELAARLLDQHDSTRDHNLMVLASLATDAGQAHRTDLLLAAAEAVVDQFPRPAERFAAAASEVVDDPRLAAVQARAWMLIGDAEQCERFSTIALNRSDTPLAYRVMAADALSASALQMKHDVSTAVRVLTDYAADTGTSSNWPILARLAQMHGFRQEVAAVRALFETHQPDDDTPTGPRMRLQSTLALLELQTGNGDRAFELCEGQSALAFRTFAEAPLDAVDTVNLNTMVLLLSGHFTAALELIDTLQGFGPRLAMPTAMLRGMRSFLVGDLGNALPDLLAGAQVGIDRPSGLMLPLVARLVAGQALGFMGRWEEAQAMIDLVPSDLCRDLPILAGEHARGSAVVAAFNGERQRGVRMLHQFADEAAARSMNVDALRMLDLASRLGDGAHSLHKMLDLRVAGPAPAAIQQHALALLHEGFDELVEAADVFEALGMRLDAAQTLREAAGIGEVQRLGRRVGEVAHRSRRLFADCHAVELPDDRPRSFTPLSRREEEVLELARLGRSNREIADELVVGVRTVEGHLSRSYVKLGIRSRAELVNRPTPPRG